MRNTWMQLKSAFSLKISRQINEKIRQHEKISRCERTAESIQLEDMLTGLCCQMQELESAGAGACCSIASGVSRSRANSVQKLIELAGGRRNWWQAAGMCGDIAGCALQVYEGVSVRSV